MKELLSYCVACLAVLVGVSAPECAVLVMDPRTPTTLYASSGNLAPKAGVFKSTDGGATWTALSLGLPESGSQGINCELAQLLIAPSTPTTLYAQTPCGGGMLSQSTDGGAHWTVVHRGTRDVTWGVVVDPQTPTTLYAIMDGGVVRSTDGGKSWHPFARSLPSGSIMAIDPLTPTTLYYGDFLSRLFKSTDGGENWTALRWELLSGEDRAGVAFLAFDPTTPATLYVNALGYTGDTLTSTRTLRSTDGGESWTALNRGWPENYGAINALVIDPQTPTTLYAINGLLGVFKSTDGGRSWTASNNGLPRYCESHVEAISTYVNSLVIDPQTPSTLYAVTFSHGGDGIFKSTDGAATWTFGHLGSPISCPAE